MSGTVVRVVSASCHAARLRSPYHRPQFVLLVGAWLGGDMVIAPRKWFAEDVQRERYTFDLYPED